MDGKTVVETRFRRRGGPAYSVRVTRALLAAVSMVSLQACGSCAELVFRLPPRSAKTRREQRALDRAKRRRVAGRWGDIAVWQWGEGPSVLLVHGWGGHAARLTDFVEPLVEVGFGVTAFDAPAHGHSSGSFATLPDFVEAIGVVAPMARPVAVIGHSMGAAAAALALRNGLTANAAVLLSPAADPERYTGQVARYLRLPAGAADAMRDRLERRYGVQVRSLGLALGGPPVPTLVFHDERDGRVPFREALAIARSWPRVELVPTRGLGHHKILRNPEVITRAVTFLRRFAGGPAALPAPADGGSAALALRAV